MAKEKSFGKTILHVGSGSINRNVPSAGSQQAASSPEAGRASGNTDRPPGTSLLVRRRVSLNSPSKEDEAKGTTAPRAASFPAKKSEISAHEIKATTQRRHTQLDDDGFSSTLLGGLQKAPVERRVLGQTVAPTTNPSAPPTQQSNQMRQNPRAGFSSTVQSGTAPVFLQSLLPHLSNVAGDDGAELDDNLPIPSQRLAQSVRQELKELNTAINSSREPNTNTPEKQPIAHGSDLPMVGRYEVLARLKRGGMGSVYLCRLVGSAGFQRLFALKVLHMPHDGTASAQRMDSFFREAHFLAQLHHPNIVGIVDIGTAAQPYLVLDYVEGGSLYELCESSPKARDPKKIVTIMLDALVGLDAAHRATDGNGVPLGLVHCDLTPHNLLVGVDGACRIADFGIASTRTDQTSSADDPIWGKPGYMAPERLLGQPPDQRSDIFSMGVVLYTALTGVEPFKGKTTEETMRNVREATVAPPSQVGLFPPPALDWVCMTALEKNPNARFQSADEMLGQLRRISARQELFASPSSVASWVQDALGPKLEERRALVRRTTESSIPPRVDAPSPGVYVRSTPPPADLGRMVDSDSGASPPSSYAKRENTVQLSADELLAAARLDLDDEPRYRTVVQDADELLRSHHASGFWSVASLKKNPRLYVALAATAVILVLVLLFPNALGNYFRVGGSNDPLMTNQQYPDQARSRVDNTSVKSGVDNKSPAQPKQVAPAQDDPTEPQQVTLPRIKTASEIE